MAKKKKAAVKKVTAVSVSVAAKGRQVAGPGGVVVKDEEGMIDGSSIAGPLPCPVAADPSMGDKTPAVMAWYREHAPAEYARRYGNRVFPGVGEMMGRTQGCGGGADGDGERGPMSDFEDEEEEVVKPRVIMG